MKSAQEKIDLISEWLTFFMKNTESWYSDQAGELGAQIAYLCAAIAADDGTQNEYFEDEEIILFLKEHEVPETASIWEYIYVLRTA